MIMSVLGIVCHLILYFHINQGLAIILPWPACKNKQSVCLEHFEVFLTSSADQCFIYFIIFLLLLTIYTYKLLKSFRPQNISPVGYI